MLYGMAAYWEDGAQCVVVIVLRSLETILAIRAESIMHDSRTNRTPSVCQHPQHAITATTATASAEPQTWRDRASKTQMPQTYKQSNRHPRRPYHGVTDG